LCRLAGIIDPSNQHLQQDILLMRDAMHRGGPDAAGLYLDEEKGLALGHRRLSIIDLSESGNQPMLSDDGQLVLVFNGEIYNYKELQAELKCFGYQFRTNSDSEVIIKAYQKWGTGCFDKFRGMFAIALYDITKGQLVLARDHAAIKPLYYYNDGKKLYFASEIRAFNTLNRFEENENWRVFFLTYGFLPSPVTTLKKVQPLEKGSYLVIDVQTFKTEQYYFYTDNYSEKISSEKEAIELVRSSLCKAVKRHLVADAPLGVFLSGGIDSSLLALLAKEQREEIHTLSIIFDDMEFSEDYYQEIIAKKINSDHRKVLLDKEHFLEALADFREAMDQPSADGINSYFISKYARENGLKAVLSGLGADELFGGYTSFKRGPVIQKLSKLPAFALSLAKHFPKDKYRKISFLKYHNARGEYLFNRGYFHSNDVARFLDSTPREVRSILSSLPNPITSSPSRPLSHGNRTSFLESNIYMQDQLLRDADVMSMWHGLEVRVPFLDRDLVEASQAISSTLKFGSAQAKHLLVKSFIDILPEEIWRRKKKGFVFPFDVWMKDRLQQFSERKDQRLEKRFNTGDLNWSRYWTHHLSRNFQSYNMKAVAKQKILFLNLTAFSVTGGIEKFNKCFLKALNNIQSEKEVEVSSFSAYDKGVDENYFPEYNYRCFAGNRPNFVLQSIRTARHYDQVIIGHINLSIIGYFIKILYPAKKVILVTHGIEVWEPLKGFQKFLVKNADLVLSVSNFTKNKLVEVQGVDAEKVSIFPNTLDPYFPIPLSFEAVLNLRTRYGLKKDDIVLYTLTRLSGKEKYKGYDRVIQCLPELLKTNPKIKYLVAGKYDWQEKQRLDDLIQEAGVQSSVVFAGFIPDEELQDHYLLADLFIMPSTKEGFGIVFIEAMIHGLQVIAGNVDGSVDALRNGELGNLIDPYSTEQMTNVVKKIITGKQTLSEKLHLQQSALKHFGFEKFESRLKTELGVKDKKIIKSIVLPLKFKNLKESTNEFTECGTGN
jgi:asparagine synthase (glutamine-hydrolysing)